MKKHISILFDLCVIVLLMASGLAIAYSHMTDELEKDKNKFYGHLNSLIKNYDSFYEYKLSEPAGSLISVKNNDDFMREIYNEMNGYLDENGEPYVDYFRGYSGGLELTKVARNKNRVEVINFYSKDLAYLVPEFQIENQFRNNYDPMIHASILKEIRKSTNRGSVFENLQFGLKYIESNHNLGNEIQGTTRISKEVFDVKSKYFYFTYESSFDSKKNKNMQATKPFSNFSITNKKAVVFITQYYDEQVVHFDEYLFKDEKNKLYLIACGVAFFLFLFWKLGKMLKKGN